MNHSRLQDEGGLSNEDFRRLLETPAVVHVDGKVKNITRVPVKEDVARRQSTMETEEEDSTYRDRAEERRRGMPNDGLDTEEEPFVKGLDYSLLEKARKEREMVKKQKEKEDQQQKEKVHAAAPSEKKERTSKPFSTLAKNIEMVLMELAERKKPVEERMGTHTTAFSHGRISYVYNTDGDDMYEIPKMKMRAATNRHGSKNTKNAISSLPQSLLEEISNVMQYTVHGSRSVQRPAAVQQRASPKATVENKKEKEEEEEEEEDIFGDVGTDYVPEKMVDKPEDKRVTSYFEHDTSHEADKNDRTDLDVARLVQEQIIKKDTLKNNVLQEQTDGYDECYPGYFDTGAMLDDSDEDGRADEEVKPKISKKQELKREQAKEKAKIEHELTNIQKIFDDKGYEHTAAFHKKGRTKHHSGDEPVVGKKKRRI